jgi:hypothetical protein
MVESKRILVAFDQDNPGQKSSDLLVPIQAEDGELALLGIRSEKLWKHGLVVLTSRAINENDLFARLVDTGRRIPRVDDCLSRLRAFVEQLRSVKIGNIVSISSNDDGLKLCIAANTPGGFAKADD